MLCAEAVLSDSEEDRGPEAVAQQDATSVWSSKRERSAERGGYSSEASSEQGENMHVCYAHILETSLAANEPILFI